MSLDLKGQRLAATLKSLLLLHTLKNSSPDTETERAQDCGILHEQSRSLTVEKKILEMLA